MRSQPSIWNAALILSVATLLSFMARAFIDYGFVYRELYPTTGSIGILTLVYVAFLAGWIWALLSASHMAKRAMYALLAYGAIIALHAGVTLYSFCPFPCRPPRAFRSPVRKPDRHYRCRTKDRWVDRRRSAWPPVPPPQRPP